MFKFDNTYSKLPEKFFAPATPTKASSPKLLKFNDQLATRLGLSTQHSNKELAAIFSGQTVPMGAQPIALAYAGHQFGHFVPQLGDGRAILLGEVTDVNDKRFDIQFKGSGRTTFSRRGDGKCPLGPAIREYIVSEAMHHLGVPTTRGLAIVSTGDPVYRQQALPGAIFTRVASSHIRIGTFEYFASQEDVSGVKDLADYSINRHYPHIKNSKNPYLSFFQQVINQQISLITHWMALGFIHGVMNTDNTLISGETIDYGPCAFMDDFNFHQVFSYIDQSGRYSYGNQLEIILWNFSVLGSSLISLIDSNSKKAISLLEEKLTTAGEDLQKKFFERMAAKLGITYTVSDQSLVLEWLQYLQRENLDYTLSFRQLAMIIDEQEQSDFFPMTEKFKDFLYAWRGKLANENLTYEQIKSKMNGVNPVFIPRNHQVERAIELAISSDMSVFEDMCEILVSPYEEQPKFAEYKKAPRPEEKITATFCGT